MPLNHLHTGASIAFQGQQVNLAAIQQTECHGRVPQAVDGSGLTVGRISRDASQTLQVHELPTVGHQQPFPVLQVGQKHITVGPAVPIGSLQGQ